MSSLIIAAEAAHTAADFEDDLLPIAIGLAVAGLVYAAVAAWLVTTKASHH